MRINFFHLISMFLGSFIAQSVGYPSERPLNQPILASAAKAASVAKVILEGIYGSDVVSRELPLKAALTGSVWTVVGSGHSGSSTNFSHSPQVLSVRIHVGGVAMIKLDKWDCRVLMVTHGE